MFCTVEQMLLIVLLLIPTSSAYPPTLCHRTITASLRDPFEAKDAVTRRSALITAAAAIVVTPDLRHFADSTLHSTKPPPEEVQSCLNEAHDVWNTFWERKRYRPRGQLKDLVWMETPVEFQYKRLCNLTV